ncbi:hypothetical protein CPLU01_15998 [Colletotrichum plurivorum]|uniref:Uncharacterized protein n=1 Tax=Colletotrichum plurivorum TaxID=2175906 RepID=A0A8H6MRA6_9PEZI|nr:hypothetical protein CPLU01_15998 [Colletotrichum plurivorum]
MPSFAHLFILIPGKPPIQTPELLFFVVLTVRLVGLIASESPTNNVDASAYSIIFAELDYNKITPDKPYNFAL